MIKFFSDLFDEQGTTSDQLLSDSDRRLMIEIISRELSDRSYTDKITTAYLSLLELILRTCKTCTRTNELQIYFRSYLSGENYLIDNQYIIKEILRQNKWLE